MHPLYETPYRQNDELPVGASHPISRRRQVQIPLAPGMRPPSFKPNEVLVFPADLYRARVIIGKNSDCIASVHVRTVNSNIRDVAWGILPKALLDDVGCSPGLWVRSPGEAETHRLEPDTMVADLA